MFRFTKNKDRGLAVPLNISHSPRQDVTAMHVVSKDVQPIFVIPWSRPATGRLISLGEEGGTGKIDHVNLHDSSKWTKVIFMPYCKFSGKFGNSTELFIGKLRISVNANQSE